MQRFLFALLVAVALIGFGCKQQQAQWSQGQSGQDQNRVVVPAPSIKSPEEIRQLETLAKLKPGNVDAWITLGNAQMDAQRYAEAIQSYQKALKLDPRNVDVRVDMGTCYRGVGRSDRALEEYRKAMKYNTRHPMAHLNAGVVLAYDLNRRAEAVKEFEKYLELAPNAPNADQIRNEIQKIKSLR